MAEKFISFSFELDRDEAWAFAEFLKRAGWNDYHSNSASEEETRLMLSAGEKIQKELALKGFAPR